MKKSALLLAVMMLIPSFACAEGLLPLSTVLSIGPAPSASASSSAVTNSTVQYTSTGTTTTANIDGNTYEATFIPASQLETDPNMVPQNAAAKGQPVPEQRKPRVRIRTKQRSQGNSYWNAGGKGFKSYYK